MRAALSILDRTGAAPLSASAVESIAALLGCETAEVFDVILSHWDQRSGDPLWHEFAVPLPERPRAVQLLHEFLPAEEFRPLILPCVADAGVDFTDRFPEVLELARAAGPSAELKAVTRAWIRGLDARFEGALG
jgi:hypothetical protein